MDTLTFIAELAKALGWPLAVVIIAVIFRRPLVAIVGTLRHLKVRDVVDVEFGRELEQAKKDAAGLPPVAEPTASAEPGPALPRAMPSDGLGFERYLAFEVDTRAAILAAWRRVERLVIDIAAGSGIFKRAWPDVEEVAHVLSRAGTIPIDLASLLDALLNLRNRLVHQPTLAPTRAQAEDYIALAERAVRALHEYLPRKRG